MGGRITAASRRPGGTFALRPVPVDRALVLRGVLGMLVPLAAGVLTGHPAAGAAAGLGAYGAALDDGAGAYRVRALSLLLPQLGGAVGLSLGRLTGGQAWAAIALMACVAFVSGLVSIIGRVSSMAGLVLLLASAMGLGLPTTGPWWQQPLLFLAGGLPLMAMSLAGRALWPHRAERRAVATAYRAVAGLIEATPETWRPARLAVTVAMNDAHDLLRVRRLRPPRRPGTPAVLLHRLDALIEVIGAAPALRLAPTPPPPAYAQCLRGLADGIESGRPAAPHALPGAPGAEQRALRDALEHVRTAAASPRLDPHPADLRRLGPHAPAAERMRDALAGVLGQDARRYALRLTACITAAEAVASLSHLPRSPWIVLTVALVVRPELGTVTSRVLLRCLGTLAGVLVAYALLRLLPGTWPPIAATCLLTGLMQAVGRRNYALQTLCLTPIMLLLADQTGHQGAALLGPRLLDTLIGCAIALLTGHLLWPEHRGVRLDARFATLYDNLAAYAEHALAPPPHDPGIHRLRRRVHRDLAVLDGELDRARAFGPGADPAGSGARWRALLLEAEETVEDITAVAAGGGGDRSDPGLRRDGGHLAQRLRDTARARRAV